MKAYLACLTFITLYSNAAEQPKEAREWDAQAYAQGNRFQEIAAFKFLENSTFNVTGQTVLDVGCGTGNITAKIAERAKKVHGIDASRNMIEYAKSTYTSPNLTFEHSLAEHFVTEKLFNKAISGVSL